MPKLNRGSTKKVSIKLSAKARKKIEAAARNLGVSSAVAILFELTRILKNPPSKSEVEFLEQKIELEGYFPMSVSEKLNVKLDKLKSEYGMKKGALFGLIISNYYENASIAGVDESKKLMVQVNTELKVKMDQYCEENYIPLSSVVAYSIDQGPFEGVPRYKSHSTLQFFTTVPEHLGDKVIQEAAGMNIREHLYVALCLYKQFMTPEGRFYEEGR